VDHAVNDFLQHRMKLASALRDVGFDVHVAVPREARMQEISQGGLPVHSFHLRRHSTRPFDELRCCLSLLLLYRRLRPTVVHHIGVKPALYGGIAAYLASVPVVIHLLVGLGYLFVTRSLKTSLLRAFVERGLRLTLRRQNYRVVFQNPDDRDTLLAKGVVSRERAILIKGSGVDVSRFTREPEPAGPAVVLMASRLLWQKGVGEFFAAAQALRDRGVAARFVLLGEPDANHPDVVPLRTLEQWCDAGNVEWLGWQNDMPSFLARSHIACLPSYYGEGTPAFLLEAAASGRPIVTTDSPGCREVVHHGENGLIVPVRDVPALVAAIARLVEDAPLRTAMGVRSRELAQTESTVEQVIEANLAVYRSLLGSSAACTSPT
jgi:glycosyltransferase involved in cell wall biosynthesis